MAHGCKLSIDMVYMQHDDIHVLYGSVRSKLTVTLSRRKLITQSTDRVIDISL